MAIETFASQTIYKINCSDDTLGPKKEISGLDQLGVSWAILGVKVVLFLFIMDHFKKKIYDFYNVSIQKEKWICHR